MMLFRYIACWATYLIGELLLQLNFRGVPIRGYQTLFSISLKLLIAGPKWVGPWQLLKDIKLPRP